MQRKSKHAFYVYYLPPPENRALYDIMWKNMVESDRPQMTIQCGAGYRHTLRVTRVAFPRQQWLRERLYIHHLYCLQYELLTMV
jgi:hypothetical protein